MSDDLIEPFDLAALKEKLNEKKFVQNKLS